MKLLRLFSTHFTKNHEWFRFSSPSLAKVGITDYAQKALGDVVFVEINPQLAQSVSPNEPIGVVESVKSATDIFSPVKGRVTKINEQVLKKPSLVNQDPEGEGWLLELECEESLNCPTNFLSRQQYAEFCLKEE